MTCPNCKIELSCPCKSCTDYRRKTGKIPQVLNWEWITGEVMGCPICGYTDHADIWFDFDFKEWEEDNDKN